MGYTKSDQISPIPIMSWVILTLNNYYSHYKREIQEIKMFNTRIASAALLSVAVTMAIQAYAEEGDTGASNPIDATGTLPAAKPGECYAKVLVPAEFEVRPEEIEVQPEQETTELVQATFDVEDKEVQVRPEYTTLKVISPKYRTEKEEVEVEPARTEWVTRLDRKGIPASPALLVAAKTSGVDIDDVKPGQCFREFYTPAKFEQKDKEVLIKEEAEDYKITEAAFEDDVETVTVKESYTVKSLVKAVYDTVEEKIEIEPAKAVWKKGTGLVERIDNTTGEIMCLVEVPPKYEVLTKTILKTPATIEETEVPAVTKDIPVKKLVSDAEQEKVKIDAEYTKVVTRAKVEDAQFTWRDVAEGGDGTYTGHQICLKDIPAKFTTISKQVLDTPASVEEEKVSAEFKTIKVEKVATSAEVKTDKIPAVTKTIEKRVKISDERLEWRRVLCKTNMTPEMNKKIQQALKDAGFYNGPVDGSIGRGTLSAVERYQKDKDLPRGGLTIKVLEDLGVM
jgi:hypothetical protein